jgi:hypothetical protein
VHFALDPLIQLLEARNENPETIPSVLGISTNVFRNLKARGVTWARADELAVRCGLFPWQVWPEWSAVDPEQWMGPSCPANHGWSEMVPNPDLRGEYCRVCKANAEAAEVQAA